MKYKITNDKIAQFSDEYTYREMVEKCREMGIELRGENGDDTLIYHAHDGILVNEIAAVRVGLFVNSDEPRFHALEHAVDVYGETLTIGPRVTVHTLQGTQETGYRVYGRGHGGDLLGCIFATRELAVAYIDEIQQGTRSQIR